MIIISLGAKFDYNFEELIIQQLFVVILVLYEHCPEILFHYPVTRFVVLFEIKYVHFDRITFAVD